MRLVTFRHQGRQEIGALAEADSKIIRLTPPNNFAAAKRILISNRCSRSCRAGARLATRRNGPSNSRGRNVRKAS